MEEKIVAALREKGPMTSTELSEALEMEWTEFSVPLLNMLRTDFNKDGSVLSKTMTGRGPGPVYYLPGQIV